MLIEASGRQLPQSQSSKQIRNGGISNSVTAERGRSGLGGGKLQQRPLALGSLRTREGGKQQDAEGHVSSWRGGPLGITQEPRVPPLRPRLPSGCHPLPPRSPVGSGWAWWPPGPYLATTWLRPGPGSPPCPSLSARLCLRLRVRRCTRAPGREPRRLRESRGKGCQHVPVEVWGSPFLFSDGSQTPAGWLCRVQAPAPVAAGDSDDSCGQASVRQACRGAEGGQGVKAE